MLRSRRYQVATGSNDDTIRIWDLRMHQAIATIPAHKSAVSDLKFFQAPPKANAYPDCELPRVFAPLPIFAGEEEQSADVTGDKAAPSNAGTGISNGSNGTMEKPDFPLSGSFLVSSGFDGYVKVWSADDWQLVRTLSNDKSGKVMSVDVSSGTLLSTKLVLSTVLPLVLTKRSQLYRRRPLHRERTVRSQLPPLLSSRHRLVVVHVKNDSGATTFRQRDEAKAFEMGCGTLGTHLSDPKMR